MYSFHESARLKQEFWSTFGAYMKPVVSADGSFINWINYKTGEKDVVFRMDATIKEAKIGVEILHRDEGIRKLYFEKFLQLKPIFTKMVGEEWSWLEKDINANDKSISSISKKRMGCSLYKKEDWAEIISFLKPRIMALDAFWNATSHLFDGLQ